MGRKAMRFFDQSDLPEENLYRAVAERAIRDALVCAKIDTSKSPANQKIDPDALAESIDALSWLCMNDDIMLVGELAGIEPSSIITRADIAFVKLAGNRLRDVQLDVLPWALKHIKKINVPASRRRISLCLSRLDKHANVAHV